MVIPAYVPVVAGVMETTGEPLKAMPMTLLLPRRAVLAACSPYLRELLAVSNDDHR